MDFSKNAIFRHYLFQKRHFPGLEFSKNIIFTELSLPGMEFCKHGIFQGQNIPGIELSSAYRILSIELLLAELVI